MIQVRFAIVQLALIIVVIIIHHQLQEVIHIIALVVVDLQVNQKVVVYYGNMSVMAVVICIIHLLVIRIYFN